MNGHDCSSIWVTLITLQSESSNRINVIQATTEKMQLTHFQILQIVTLYGMFFWHFYVT